MREVQNSANTALFMASGSGWRNSCFVFLAVEVGGSPIRSGDTGPLWVDFPVLLLKIQ